jgi:hypothetical protein
MRLYAFGAVDANVWKCMELKVQSLDRRVVRYGHTSSVASSSFGTYPLRNVFSVTHRASM